MSIREFLSSINTAIRNGDDIQKKKKETNKTKVQLKSMHCSKGEQAPVVFVVGFSQGLLPHFKSVDIESERLLGYVALSRAEEEMYVSSILSYNDRQFEVSEFLYSCFDDEVIDEKINKCVSKSTESTFDF